ncbi:MFS transporter [Clostridium tunisiense]|uniref:MFS transporter n=1 Tax=Clostridium tunisiense TaxID=219748 RepID=UPI0002D913A9|nr:MFS transporter [Clostridium tunisiense]
MNREKQNWKKVFALIYTGQAFSIIGSAAVQFAIIWWLTVKTGSAITLTSASIVGFLPQALIGPFAGVWVDRYNRKTVMILADSLVALSSVVLGVAFLLKEPSVSFIYGILFIRALGSTFHAPALQASIPMLVPPEDLVKAGGFGQMINSGTSMAGPVIGAALMSVASIQSIMLVDIIGAALAIITLLFVKIPDIKGIKRELNFIEDMKQGIKAIGSNRPLRALTLPIILTTIAYVPLSSLFPLLIRVHFNGTAWHNGVTQFFFATGLLVSSLVIGVWGGLKKQFLMISLSLMFLGIVASIGGVLPSNLFIGFVGISFLIGFIGTFFSIPYMAYMQRSVEQEKLGKVMSLMMSIMSLATPVGLAISGPISELIGVNIWFEVSGVAIFFSGVLCYFMTRKYE